MDRSTTGLPVHHQLLGFTQTHVHWVGDAIQPSHPLSSPSPPAFNFSQHQGLFQWVSSSHQVAKVLEFQLQHQSFLEYSGLISFMANRWGNSGKSDRLYFWGAPKSLQMVMAAMKLKTLAPWKKSYDQPRQHIKKQRCYFVNKGASNQSYGFSSSHVWMWELDYKESWALKNWCFWTVVLERTVESLLDCKKIQPVHPKGN